jgi:hypothetical protein
VARAILTAFVGSAPDGHIAYHIDRDITNNKLDNLKWEPISSQTKKRKRTKSIKINRNSYKVEQVDITTGNIIKIWDSATTAAKSLDLSAKAILENIRIPKRKKHHRDLYGVVLKKILLNSQ